MVLFCHAIAQGWEVVWICLADYLDSAETERTVFGVGVLQNDTRYGQTVFHCSCMN